VVFDCGLPLIVKAGEPFVAEEVPSEKRKQHK
jgi:hypothetical protein